MSNYNCLTILVLRRYHTQYRELILLINSTWGINEIWQKCQGMCGGDQESADSGGSCTGSIGLEGGEAARIEIWILVND